MTAQVRNYTTKDYGDLRYHYDNRLLDGSVNAYRSVVQSPVGANQVPRLFRLNLMDGDELAVTAGDLVKLSGLGVKTAEEAIRFGIIIITSFASATDLVTAEGHGYRTTDQVQLSTTGSLPAGLNSTTGYWVVNPTQDTFQLSLTQGGAVVNFTSTGSGTAYSEYF